MSFDSVIAAIAQVAPSLGAFLLAYLVHSTVLIGLAWALTSRRVGLPVHVREYVWKGAVFGGIFTALLATASPAWRPSILLPAFARSTPVAQSAPAVADPAPQILSISSMPTDERFARLVGPVTPPVPLLPNAATIEILPEPGKRDVPVGVWLSGAFLAIAGFGLARLCFERARLSRTLGERLPVVGGPLARIFEELSVDANLAGEVHLTQSHRLPTPVAIGAAEVCIPEGVLESLPRAEQRCILAHEIAHLIRRDPTWRIALRALESVFFFQPLNRVARARIQELAEFACDDYAAQNTQEGGIMMARSLASAAQWIESIQAPALAAALTRLESPLVQRVERLLGEPESRNLSQRQRALVVVASASLAVLGAVAPTFAAEEPPTAPEPPAAPSAPEAPEAPTRSRVYVYQNGAQPGVPAPPNARTIAVGKNGKVSIVSSNDAPNATAYVVAGEDGDAPQVYAFTNSGPGAAPFATNVRWLNGQGGKRPAIGVVLNETGGALASQLGINAESSVVIGDVSPDSAAEKAGLQKHDIVLKINGEDASSDNLRRIISETEIGKSVELEVLRAGKPQKFTVNVEEREDSGAFFSYALGNGAAPNAFAFDNELADKVRAQLEASMADPNTTAEARRALELALERATAANSFFPSELPARDMAEFERSMAEFHRSQAQLEAGLARLHALEGLGAESMPAIPGIPSPSAGFSEVRSRFFDGVAADIANRLTKRDASLNWDVINELAKAAVQNSFDQAGKFSESITCKNGECTGTLTVDVKNVATAVTRELRNNAEAGGFANNSDIEKWLSDEVTDAVRANNNKKATWTD